jgi:DHA1 family tetracycline resistance protein-like MFS transporter
MSDIIKTEKKNNPLLPIFFTIFLDLLGFGLILPVLTPLVLNNDAGIIPASFTLDDRKIVFGLLLAIYSLSQFLSNSILGAISDRIGRRKTLIFSLIATLLGYVFLTGGIHAQSLILVFIGRIVPGLAAGNIAICYSAIADVSDESNKTKNFALIGVAFGFGFVIGPFIGGILSNPELVSWFNYDTPFFAAVFLSVINIILAYFYFDETLKEKNNKKINLFTGIQNINKAFLHPTLRSLFIVIFVYNLGFAFFTSFFMVLLVEKFNFKQQDIGMMYGYLGICVVFAQGFFVRKISKIYKPEKIAIFFLPVLAVSISLVVLPNQSYWLYALLPFIAIGQSSSSSSTTALISNYGGKSIQGEILGITMSMNSLAQGIPGLIGGSLSNWNIYLPTLMSGVLALIGWIILYRFLNKSHSVVESV